MLGNSLVPPFLVLPACFGMPLSQDQGEERTLIINGKTTQVPMVQVKGRSYIGLEALANAVNGSLRYSGNMIALSVPIRSGNGGAAADTSSNAPAPAPSSPVESTSSNAGFSQGFLTAGIEQMSTLREWTLRLQQPLKWHRGHRWITGAVPRAGDHESALCHDRCNNTC